MWTDGYPDRFATVILTVVRVFDNVAPSSANIHPAGGLVYFKLPTPPGHWLPNADCIASRRPCGTTATYADVQCRTKGCPTLAGQAPNWTPQYCQAPTFIQVCEWQTSACAASPPTDDCLLGKKVYTVLLPVEENMPYSCAAGYLGSNESALQTTSSCAGKCPAGFFCPNVSTLIALPCPAGHYCVEGSVTPTSCPGGTSSNETQLLSVDGCGVCPAGSSCPIGATAALPCLPGSFAATAASSKCELCPPGSFSSASNAVVCDNCTTGYLCLEGSSA